MGQINENEMVKKELELLEDDSAVFKLQGPVLVKQELADARQNVASRLKYLTSELERIEKEIKGKHDEMDACQKKLQELSETLKAMQDAAVKAAQQQQAKAGKK
jgi:prefoldin beta subunit